MAESKVNRIVHSAIKTIPAPVSPATYGKLTYILDAPAGYRVVSHGVSLAEDFNPEQVAEFVDYGYTIGPPGGGGPIANRVVHVVANPGIRMVTFQTVFERSDEPDVFIQLID